jgi:hypothetical protein
MMKSRRMGYAGRVACMGEVKIRIKFESQSLQGRYHLKDVGVYGRIILILILKKQNMKLWN